MLFSYDGSRERDKQGYHSTRVLPGDENPNDDQTEEPDDDPNENTNDVTNVDPTEDNNDGLKLYVKRDPVY